MTYTNQYFQHVHQTLLFTSSLLLNKLTLLKNRILHILNRIWLGKSFIFIYWNMIKEKKVMSWILLLWGIWRFCCVNWDMCHGRSRIYLLGISLQLFVISMSLMLGKANSQSQSSFPWTHFSQNFVARNLSAHQLIVSNPLFSHSSKNVLINFAPSTRSIRYVSSFIVWESSSPWPNNKTSSGTNLPATTKALTIKIPP